MGVQSEAKFLGGERGQIGSICQCVKYALPFDSAISRVKIYPLKIHCKCHMISPLTGTQSPQEKSKQNTTRDIEIKNILTIARGEWGVDSGERGL